MVDSRVLFNADDEPHVREVVSKLASRHAFLNNTYFRSFPDFIFHPDRLLRSAVDFCLPVLSGMLAVTPDGECYTCTQSVGNILKEDIAEVWSSPRRKSFLKKLAACGQCPAPCWLTSNSAQTRFAGGVTKLFIRMMR